MAPGLGQEPRDSTPQPKAAFSARDSAIPAAKGSILSLGTASPAGARGIKRLREPEAVARARVSSTGSCQPLLMGLMESSALAKPQALPTAWLLARPGAELLGQHL